MDQKPVVTPTPSQRVLSVSNGPQRIQRPVSHQKPVSHVTTTVKPTYPSNQNVNPATPTINPETQPKLSSQQNQPKTNVCKVNPEPAKNETESLKQEKPQSKYTETELKSSKFTLVGQYCLCFAAQMYPLFCLY